MALFVFGANFSKMTHNKSTKDWGSAVPLIKASPWISMCAGWAAHKGNGKVGAYVERQGQALGVGAEHLAVLRGGTGLKPYL